MLMRGNPAGSKTSGPRSKWRKLREDKPKGFWQQLADGAPGESLSIKDFVVLDKLGQGGFGTVLRVRQLSDRKLYALKEISKRAIQSSAHGEQVLAESEALMELRHPLIVSMYGAFQDAAHVYFLLELAEGGNLMQQLERRPGRVFPEDWCCFYSAQVAIAISHVHHKGFVYRDLKLDNVLVGANGHAKLADFGLATRIAGRRRVTALAGTPHMLAPEVLMADSYGSSVDWWGLGLIMCEMLLGFSPLHWVCGPEDISTLPNTFQKQLHLPNWKQAPVPVSSNAKQVVEGFLKVDTTKRLCCSVGIRELQAQAWFDGCDWDSMARLDLEPPLAKELANLLQPKDAGAPMSPTFEKRESDDPATRDAERGLLLCEAAASGHIKEIRELLSRGIPIDAGDFDQRTALHVVCSVTADSPSRVEEASGLKVVKFLVDKCGASVNAVDRWGFTPLQDALRSGRQDVVKFLKSKGAHNGSAPYTDIFSAAALGDIALLKRLVASGVDVNQGDFDSRRALHVAASEGLLDVVVFLVDEAGAAHSVADRWGNTPLGNAMFAGKDDVVEFLHSRGATGAIQANREMANNAFNLNNAAAKGDLEALRRLVRNGVDVNEGDYDSRRALHLAASEGLLRVVKFLVDEAGADHSPTDRWGFTPLADAIRAHKTAVVDFLRLRGADEGKQRRLSTGDSARKSERKSEGSRGSFFAPRKSEGSRGSFFAPHNSFLAPEAPMIKLLPDPLVCPLSQTRFECPMVAEDGFTYEHAAFEAWTAKHGRISPITGEPMPSRKLIPNRALDAVLKRQRTTKKANSFVERPAALRTCLPQACLLILAFLLVGGAVAFLEVMTFSPPVHDGNPNVTLDPTGTDFSFFYEDAATSQPGASRRMLLGPSPGP